mmetsp:Transcript_57/g.156  ORF Transcript_57/g.156 Transcript_57/m.156 type:complete len:232 (+) Transcript_57:851-1546(+)
MSPRARLEPAGVGAAKLLGAGVPAGPLPAGVRLVMLPRALRGGGAAWLFPLAAELLGPKTFAPLGFPPRPGVPAPFPLCLKSPRKSDSPGALFSSCSGTYGRSVCMMGPSLMPLLQNGPYRGNTRPDSPPKYFRKTTVQLLTVTDRLPLRLDPTHLPPCALFQQRPTQVRLCAFLRPAGVSAGCRPLRAVPLVAVNPRRSAATGWPVGHGPKESSPGTAGEQCAVAFASVR